MAGEAVDNQQRFAASNVEFHGVSLKTLRQQARRAVLALAREYTSCVADEAELRTEGPWIVTGHQPELFHAGVWAKNFASSSLGKRLGGATLNLVIDNDTLESSSVRVPVGSREAPAVEWIPFDTSAIQRPWEESSIVDAQCFASFGQRVAERIRECWGYTPLVHEGWDAAVRRARETSKLCDGLTAARIAVERAHGVCNLEVPMSRVCETPTFCQFAAQVISQLPQFQAVYNQAVRGYRDRHHLHSQTHPVPDLIVVDGWSEAPFWVWHAGAARRERLFAQRNGNEILLRGAKELIGRLPAAPDKPLTSAVEALLQLSQQGIRVRSRALTTTLFARMFLADLFIHGIGGAAYDEMTDEICRVFFQCPAPTIGVVTATLHLPLPPPFDVTPADFRKAGQRIREFRYNPDRGNDYQESSARQLVEEKRQLIDRFQARQPSRSEHRRIEEINRQLTSRAPMTERDLRSARERVRRQLQANSILQDREFSWCLHSTASVEFFQHEFGMAQFK